MLAEMAVDRLSRELEDGGSIGNWAVGRGSGPARARRCVRGGVGCGVEQRGGLGVAQGAQQLREIAQGGPLVGPAAVRAK